MNIRNRFIFLILTSVGPGADIVIVVTSTYSVHTDLNAKVRIVFYFMCHLVLIHKLALKFVIASIERRYEEFSSGCLIHHSAKCISHNFTFCVRFSTI